MADFLGDNGINILVGANEWDVMYGRGGNDLMYGNAQHDAVYGEGGNDTLYGGYGNDDIRGGRGADKLFGGPGKDVFYSERGESLATNGRADIIYDWNAREDTLHTFLGGLNTWNYGEARTSAGSIASARYQAEHSVLRQKDFAFLYNPVKDIGFVLADVGSNGSFETGYILKGAGSARDFSPYDFWSHL